MDQIGRAIEAPVPEPHAQVTVTISSTQRHVAMSFPTGMTDQELLEFIGWLGTAFRMGLLGERAAKDPASRLVVAKGVLPPPVLVNGRKS